jgi:hypothetical protein
MSMAQDSVLVMEVELLSLYQSKFLCDGSLEEHGLENLFGDFESVNTK